MKGGYTKIGLNRPKTHNRLPITGKIMGEGEKYALPNGLQTKNRERERRRTRRAKRKEKKKKHKIQIEIQSEIQSESKKRNQKKFTTSARGARRNTKS